MISIKIQCGCGQKFAFDVEPVNGRLPAPVACPVCGADGTAAANQIIAQQLAAPSPPPSAAPALSLNRPAAAHTPVTAPRSPVTNAKAPADRRRILMPALVGGLVVILGAGGFVWWQRSGNTGSEGKVVSVVSPAEPDWPNTLAGLNAWYVEPPAGQNAATFYVKGFAALQVTAADRNSPDLPVIGKGAMPALGAALPAKTKAAITAFTQRNKPAWDALTEGREFDQARYPMDLSKGYDTLLPHLTKVKQTAQIGELMAIQMAEGKQPQAAADVLLSSLAVAQSLKSEPLLISQLVRVSCLAIEKAALERVVNSVALPPAELERLSAAFAKAEDEESAGTAVTRSIVGERACVLASLDLAPDQLEARLKEVTEGRTDETGASMDETVGSPQNLGIKPLTQNLKAQRAFAEETFNRSLALRKAPLPGRLEADSYFTARMPEARSNQFSICMMLMPALGKVTVREAVGLAELRVAQTALALERFRAANANRYPDALSELAPAFLPAVPSDPFTGQPLRYQKSGVGYELESTGNQPDKPILFKVLKAPEAARQF